MAGLEVGDLSIANKLTSLADVNRLLNEIKARERSIETLLEGLQVNRVTKEKEIATLQASTSELLDLAISDAEGLSNSVQQTSALSERVSRKVRELDTAQSRAQQAAERVHRLVNRTKAVTGVQQAIAVNDYETAARYVEEHLQLQRDMSVDGQSESIHPSEQEKILANARSQLLETIQQNLARASSEGDHQAVLRFVRLYGPLGAQEQGTTWLVKFICEQLQKQADENYTLLVESTDVDFVGVLSELLSSIGTAIQEHEALVAEAFGKEKLLQVLDGLQQLCDQNGGRIVQRFIKHRSLDKTVQDIRGHRAVQTGQTQATISTDPRLLEGLLEEMLMLCQRGEEYNQFMLSRVAEAFHPKVTPPGHENAFRTGAFNTSIRELTSYYINIEEFYIERSVEKGIEIDTWSGHALASSMVDDVFFILQKCSQRGLATGSLQCVGAIMGQINSVLSSSLRAALDAQWKAGCAILLQGLSVCMATEPRNPDVSHGAAAAALNNADLSASYASKLQEQLSLMAADVFPAAHDQERIRSVLSDLGKTAADFQGIANRAIDHLSAGSLLQLRSAFEEGDNSSYEITEGELGADGEEFLWVVRLMNTLAITLQWFQPLLTVNNYDNLISNLLGRVVERLEASMNLKRFTQLGGLQLDMHVRTIVSTLSEMTQRTVRDKFARLSQMATLLSLETVDEVLDYWGDSSDYNWTFTEGQVKAILEQRTDFDSHEISMLKLR